MAGVAMALLTQEWGARLEQIRGRRAVRVMADAAVLLHRLMIMDKGAAFFRVTAETGFIDARAHELLGIVAMHVMT